MDQIFFYKKFQKYFKNPTGIFSSEQLRKVESVKPFGHSRASKIMKKCHILTIFPVLGKLTHICDYVHMWFFCMYGYPHKPYTLHVFFQFVICRYKYAHKLKCICAYKKNPHCHHLVSIIAGASRFSCRLLEVRPSQFGLKSVPGVSAVTSCSSLIHSFP